MGYEPIRKRMLFRFVALSPTGRGHAPLYLGRVRLGAAIIGRISRFVH